MLCILQLNIEILHVIFNDISNIVIPVHTSFAFAFSELLKYLVKRKNFVIGLLANFGQLNIKQNFQSCKVEYRIE